MFKEFTFSAKYVLLRALLDQVRRNTGLGFHNNDQGHPAYTIGKSGKWDYNAFGDSPEHNSLYQMLKDLSEELKDCRDFRHCDLVFSWADFCRLATDAYAKKGQSEDAQESP